MCKFRQLVSRLNPKLTIFLPSNKAVADGAISFFVDHFVAARVSKLAYGTSCMTRFQSNNAEHIARSAMKFRDLSGDWMVGGVFSVILPKVGTLRLIKLS